MTSRQIYEAILIELNKNNAPSLRLHEFNYLFNKAINEYVDEIYQNYDVNQSATDSLRVLQSEAQLEPHEVTINYPSTVTNKENLVTNITNGISTVVNNDITTNGIKFKQNLSGATYEVFMPEDYLHILNCTCIYFVKQQNKCYDAGDYIEIPATKLTADTWSTIMTDIYNRPSPMKPYYYIHNRNTQSDLPTNPVHKEYDTYPVQGASDMIKKEIKSSVGNDIDIHYECEVSDKEKTYLLYSKDRKKWYTDTAYKKLAEDKLTSTIDQDEIQFIKDTPFSNVVYLNRNEYSTIEKQAYLRISNPQKVRMEIRYGKDNSVYQLVEVRVDYVKSPQFIRLTQDQIDLTADTSQIMEFPDYICQKIINKLVALLLERSSDPRLTTNVQINRSMVAPAQPQTQQT